MSNQHSIAAARKLGAYVDCAPDILHSVLRQQTEHPGSGRRLGELLLEQGIITPTHLQACLLQQRIGRLRACPVFSRGTLQELEGLAAVFEEMTVPPGVQFITQDETEPFFYVLAAGRLEVFRCMEGREEQSFSTFLPGEPIGEIGYFSKGVRSASVRALERSELLIAGFDELSNFMAGFPALSAAFGRVMSDRLRDANERFLDNQYRLQAVEASLQRLNEFLDLSDAAELGLGIEGLIHRLVRTASGITDADRSSLFLIDRSTGELWSKVAEGQDVKEIRVPPGTGIVGWVAQHKELLNVGDAYADKRFNPIVDKGTGYRTRTILCAPMWSLSNEVLGVVQVINKRAGVFNDNDESLLRAFAHQAAIAVENFNLYRKMMLSHKRMSIMLDIATSIGKTLDLGGLIREIVGKTIEVLQCDRASFFVLDRKLDELWSMVARGSELKEIRFPALAGIAGDVAGTGAIANIRDAYEDPHFNRDFDRQSGYRTRSVLCAPVFDRAGTVIGVVQAINKLKGGFDAEDEELIQAIGSQIGVSLENAALHADTVKMKNYLESVQQSISNSILTLDMEKRLVTINNAGRAMFPVVRERAAGFAVNDLLGSENGRLSELLDRVYRTRRGTVEYDVDLRHPSGINSTVNVNVLPLKDGENQFNGLVLVLDDITNEKRVKSAFSRYLAPAVIEQLLADPGRLSLGGEKRELTFLFTDIAGFTAFSEKTEPTDLVKMLNGYFDEMCNIVLRYGGTIDKIVGDAVHVMFNAPTDQPDHAQRAVDCAMELADYCTELASRYASDGIPFGETRIGINTGAAVVGNFGGSSRFNYTAYGDSVNSAARLEGANKFLGTRICVSQTTRDSCFKGHFRPVAQIIVQGRVEAIPAYEPLNHTEEQRDIDYLRAYRMMEDQDPRAVEVFAKLASQYPNDELIKFHTARLRGGARGVTITLAGK